MSNSGGKELSICDDPPGARPEVSSAFVQVDFRFFFIIICKIGK